MPTSIVKVAGLLSAAAAVAGTPAAASHPAACDYREAPLRWQGGKGLFGVRAQPVSASYDPAKGVLRINHYAAFRCRLAIDDLARVVYSDRDIGMVSSTVGGLTINFIDSRTCRTARAPLALADEDALIVAVERSCVRQRRAGR